jgi:hypothetical protein
MVDYRREPATGGELATLARTWGCDEYIDLEARQVSVKSGGRPDGWGLTGSGFGAHFHSDSIYVKLAIDSGRECTLTLH